MVDGSNDRYRSILPGFNYTAFDRDADEQTACAFDAVLQRSPYPFQLKVRRHLARMSHEQHPQPTSSLLMVQPTAAGKSSVRDMHACIIAGYTLAFVPLLSLGTDQSTKMKPFSRPESGLVNSINLDDYKGANAQAALIASFLPFQADTKQTFILFASPQTIANSELFQQLIVTLILKRLLRLVCCDEIHLMVRFGASGFRKEFGALRPLLFNLLRVNQYAASKKPVKQTLVPIMFMTATCSYQQVKDLESLTGISIGHDINSVFWPDADGMFNPIVTIDIRYTEQALSVFKKTITESLKTSRTAKYIWYTNNRFMVENHVKLMASWLDATPEIKADVVPLTGNYVKEQKKWHILTYCQDTTMNKDMIETCDEAARPFNPQILAATSDVGNAGLDNPFIVGCGRAENPPSSEDFNQEKGRPGRYPGAEQDGCWYMCCTNLEAYCSLRRRIERSLRDGMPRPFYNNLLLLLGKVTRMITLPAYCIHAALAMDSANPFLPHPRQLLDRKCGDRCSFCLGDYKTIFPTVSRTGVVTVLIDVFLHQRQNNPVLTVEDTLISAIRSYKDHDGNDSKLLILKSKAKGQLSPINIKKIIMMLVAADIVGLEPKLVTEDNNLDKVIFHATLLCDSTRNLHLYDDYRWQLIPQK
jgi:hypothetical protein